MKPAILTLCSLGLILTCTISLGDLSFERQVVTTDQGFLLLKAGQFSDLDIGLNMLLFIPLGFALTQWLNRSKRLSFIYRLVSVVLIAFALSYLIELSQMFMPTRKPSLVDVAANTMGAFIGCFVHLVYTQRRFTWATWLYIAFVLVFAGLLQRQTTLQNWDLSYPFILGNERTGNRPWKGQISELLLLDMALTEVDLTNHIPSTPLGTIDLLKHVRWKKIYEGNSGLPTESRMPPIQVPVELTGTEWFETIGPPEVITQRLMKSSQFTLIARVATANTSQRGPARIVSLSWDANNRNITFGQNGTDMVVRLRTPATGENGTRPELRIPGVFAVTEPKNLAIVYDGSTLMAYVNGVRQSPTLAFTPGSVALSFLPKSNISDTRLGKVIFYPIMLLPLGILLSLTIRFRTVSKRLQVAIMLGSSLLLGAVLETVLVAVSGKSIDYNNVILGVLSVIFGMLLAVYLPRNYSSGGNELLLCKTRGY